MIVLQSMREEHAGMLFPLIYRSPVTDTLLWNGPESLEGFREGLREREEQVARGEMHLFTVFEAETGQAVGSADIRPDAANFRGYIGLWIGIPYQRKGYGSQTIAQLVAYGFETLGMEKIEAEVFVGNRASRRAFEKNGFQLEGTVRKAVRKRGAALDEWLLGFTREDYLEQQSSVLSQLARRARILHLCHQAEWQAAVQGGEYLAESLEKEGFIHCSRPDQVLRSANAFFPAARDLALLWIDPALVRSPLRWDPVGGQVFPHIYGPLNLGAVRAVSPFVPDLDGIFRDIPEP